MKYIIIGGVAGGATTAARIRRNDENAEIILLEKGRYISYANCGLPYYLGSIIKDREKLFLQTPLSFGTRFKVDVRVMHEALEINREKKELIIKDDHGNNYIESYDKLLLSPGATPVIPPLPGIESEGIFTLRNVSDTDKIKHWQETHKIKHAVVIGAGFIGLEMAENLHEIGADVSIVEMENQVMTPIDFSMASLVHQHLLQKGINLHLQQAVSGFNRKGNEIEVMFKSGQTLMADIVILSIGVRPQTTLARNASLKIGETGGIWVNEYLQTSDEHIYAVGDAIEYMHPITQKPWLNYLAVPANRQGRIVADNMVYGNSVTYEGSIGTAIAKVFDLTVATTGIPAKRLAKTEIAYFESTTHSGSHAGYYPKALPLSIKLTVEQVTGRLLGAQVVGYDGVDKRIDQIALLIKHNGTVMDLMRIEQAYAPPFSSAKDPVAIAGYVAENILRDRVRMVSWRDMVTVDHKETLVLDVRTLDEYALGSIPGAINIPVDDLRNKLGELPRDKKIYIYCAIGLRGYLAYRILASNGFEKIYNLSGGYKTYSAAIAPITIKKQTHLAAKIEDLDEQNMKSSIKTLSVDACGLQCPGPILKMKKSVDEVNIGERVEMTATDLGFARDAAAWCESTGNRLVSNITEQGKVTVVIEKSLPVEESGCNSSHKGKTIILFSDDLDKALAAFVLANGAAATGEKVSMFFTFWGLNAIKKIDKPQVEKDLFGKMFSMMLPSSSLKLKLSKMNMGGIGTKMMRYIMSKKGIESLESLRSQALESGVEFIACQMSMDVMGVKQEELLDDLTIGGVATYMNRADQSNVNLFI